MKPSKSLDAVGIGRWIVGAVMALMLSACGSGFLGADLNLVTPSEEQESGRDGSPPPGAQAPVQVERPRFESVSEVAAFLDANLESGCSKFSYLIAPGQMEALAVRGESPADLFTAAELGLSEESFEMNNRIMESGGCMQGGSHSLVISRFNGAGLTLEEYGRRLKKFILPDACLILPGETPSLVASIWSDGPTLWYHEAGSRDSGDVRAMPIARRLTLADEITGLLGGIAVRHDCARAPNSVRLDRLPVREIDRNNPSFVAEEFVRELLSGEDPGQYASQDVVDKAWSQFGELAGTGVSVRIDPDYSEDTAGAKGECAFSHTTYTCYVRIDLSDLGRRIVTIFVTSWDDGVELDVDLQPLDPPGKNRVIDSLGSPF